MTRAMWRKICGAVLGLLIGTSSAALASGADDTGIMSVKSSKTLQTMTTGGADDQGLV